ncbi:hypothetical protein CLHUN_04420 [Ruminiclostridium hungatei]|uniref:Uncharacterized protein n=1 Tax=Ruminiclostridium hungatei TaxID=48256 RepID=A0A1V4SRW2_RUMHU|nr:DUF6652 family protein [Ruminiclostridium hungatei]OPX45967.1 hypothetical protein CLHUN_04420 [Ruminiclostridium hungatei]
MKLVRNLLLGLYVNIFLVLLLVILTFISLSGNRICVLLLFAVFVTALGSGLFCIVVGVISVFAACRLFQKQEYGILRHNMKILKFSSIPYLFINFIIYYLLFIIFFVASRGTATVTPIPLFFMFVIFFTYLGVIFTSAYGIGLLALLLKEKKLKAGCFLFHLLLQLCFVLDVVDTLVLMKKFKRNGSLGR